MKNKKKDTAFFYVAVVALIIMAIMCGYHVANYNAQYNAYIEQGYDEATIKAGYPITSILPSVAESVGLYGFFAAVMFGFNSVLIALRPSCSCNTNENALACEETVEVSIPMEEKPVAATEKKAKKAPAKKTDEEPKKAPKKKAAKKDEPDAK